jgi:hypothetical protein
MKKKALFIALVILFVFMCSISLLIQTSINEMYDNQTWRENNIEYLISLRMIFDNLGLLSLSVGLLFFPMNIIDLVPNSLLKKILSENVEIDRENVVLLFREIGFIGLIMSLLSICTETSRLM